VADEFFVNATAGGRWKWHGSPLRRFAMRLAILIKAKQPQADLGLIGLTSGHGGVVSLPGPVHGFVELASFGVRGSQGSKKRGVLKGRELARLSRQLHRFSAVAKLLIRVSCQQPGEMVECHGRLRV
jgi:hypothetical protein